jgi:hypothetical protein
MESKKRWISPKDFRRTFGKMTNVLQESLPKMSIGDAPKTQLIHKYRDTDKDKWIDKKKFIL